MNSPPAEPDPELPAAEDAGSTMAYARDARRDRDHPSWNDLVRKVEARLASWVRGRAISPPYGPEDLCAEALHRVFRGLPAIELRDRLSFWAWVRTIATNTLIDFRRHARARHDGEVRQLADDQTGADLRHTTVSDLAQSRELYAALQDCLARLREEDATVLRLRLLEHRDYDYIRNAIGRRQEVTVRSIFFRGRQRLARCLRAKGYDAW